MIAVVLHVESRTSSGTVDEETGPSTLVWVATLIQILGLALVKLSSALIVLKLTVRSWHRSTVFAYIGEFET